MDNIARMRMKEPLVGLYDAIDTCCTITYIQYLESNTANHGNNGLQV